MSEDAFLPEVNESCTMADHITMHRLALLSFFVVAALAVEPIKLPPIFKTCSGNPPNGECLRDAIENGISQLEKGSRPLGVLPIDPLQMRSLAINQGSGPVTVKLDFKNLFIHGISSSRILSANLDPRNNKLSIRAAITVPIRLLSDYTIKGKVLVLPISGSGKCTITLVNPDVLIEFSGHEVTKGGHKYLTFNDLQFRLDPKRVTMHFENLFNGDKALGDNMNAFLNQNWKEVYGELKSPVERAFGTTILDITNRIFSKVPVKEIFRN